MTKGTPFGKFFGAKKAVILSNSGNLRITLRSILRQLGVPSDSILLTQSYEEALKLINEHKPEIVITEFSIEEKSCVELIDNQRTHQPIRLKSFSCVISPVSLSSQAYKALSKEVDLHLIKPITIESFEKAVSQVISQKLMPTLKLQLLEKIRLLYESKQFDEALKLIQSSLSENEDAKSLYYKGNIFKEKGELVQALDCWQHGLSVEPTNFWCLRALFKHFIEQKLPLQNYEIIVKLLDNHPFNPEWIPQITRIFIANEKYQEVIKYFDIFVNWDNLDEMDKKENIVSEMLSNIAACMVISANFVYKMGNKPLALEALIKSVRLCQDKPKILSQIIISLVGMYEFEQAQKFLSLVHPDDFSPELHGAELHILDLDEDSDPEEILKKGIELIEKGIKSQKVYEITIIRSVEFKRSIERINNLVEDACAFFPERADFFKALLEKKVSAAS